MEYLHDSNIWLVFSFLIFCFILLKYGKKALEGMLDNRIETIKKEIQTAESLRVEAQEMLAQYQRKHRDAVKEADAMIAEAEKHAIEIRKNAEEELKQTIARREKQLKDRLSTLEAQAIAEIQKHAAELSINATREIIADNMDQKTHSKLVDDCLSSIGKNLH